VSFRLRLTLWYSLLLAGLLLLIAAMALSRLQVSVSTDIDRGLRERGDQIARLLQTTLPSGPLTEILLPAVSAAAEPDLYIQVRAQNQRILYRSSNLTNLVIPLPAAYQQQAQQGRGGFYALTLDNNTSLRVYFTPILFGGEPVGVIQVARNLAQANVIISQLAASLFWIVALALGVGAGVGYWLAGYALRPIQEATATALAITRTGRLDRRVAVANARQDEIGLLIATFNEMLDRLQELFDKQRRFSADLSHELRSPLTTILGNLSLLKRGERLPPPERAEMLEEIETEAQRMNRMISDLLLLAQADADLTIAHEAVELDTLLLDVYRQAKRRAGQRDLRLLHEDQAIVRGDADRLRQMLVNLINNAIQYTSADGRIEISLECLGEQAQITLRDTGQGMAPADLPHIFDRFYRADKARSRAAGGTGLGLSIVKWVVDAHGGEIDVSSTPGVGSVFRVRLPLADGCDKHPSA